MPSVDTPRMVAASVVIGLVGIAASLAVLVHRGPVSAELSTAFGSVAVTLWSCVGLCSIVLHRVSGDRRAAHVTGAAVVLGLSALGTTLLIEHSPSGAAAAMLVALPGAVHVGVLGVCPEVDTHFSARRWAALTVVTAVGCAAIALVAGLSPAVAAGLVFVAWLASTGSVLRAVRRATRHLMWWLVICGHGMVIAAALQLGASPEGVVASALLSAVIAACALVGVSVEVRRAYADQQREAVTSMAEAAVATLRAQAVEDTEAERVHEARAALAGIGAAAESLARYRTVLEPAQFDDLSSGMVQEVARLKGLIARDAVAHVVPALDVSEAIKPAITCARATGLEIGGHLPPGLRAQSSAEVLAQVVTALLANVARHAPGSPVEIGVGRRGVTVVVTVADRGPGIPESMCERIFERGVSTSSSGLGLYVARSQLSAIGASINASPRIGGGAIFRVTLPMAEVAEGQLRPHRAGLRAG